MKMTNIDIINFLCILLDGDKQEKQCFVLLILVVLFLIQKNESVFLFYVNLKDYVLKQQDEYQSK